jgi:lysophospholipase L1-like esterase
MIFQAEQKVLFIGDSITDCGRREWAAPYGDGYVSLVRSLLIARYPELGLTFTNRGIGGDTTRELAARWERDVVAERPDWLSVMIGINDVWRAFDGDDPAEAVPLPEYEATLRRLLERAIEATAARLILAQPYMIEPDRAQPMRKAMDEYGDAVRQTASEYGAILVPVQAAFDTVLAHTSPAAWADDQIHPNQPGHAVIALAFLRACGFEA